MRNGPRDWSPRDIETRRRQTQPRPCTLVALRRQHGRVTQSTCWPSLWASSLLSTSRPPGRQHRLPRFRLHHCRYHCNFSHFSSDSAQKGRPSDEPAIARNRRDFRWCRNCAVPLELGVLLRAKCCACHVSSDLPDRTDPADRHPARSHPSGAVPAAATPEINPRPLNTTPHATATRSPEQTRSATQVAAGTISFVLKNLRSPSQPWPRALFVNADQMVSTQGGSALFRIPVDITAGYARRTSGNSYRLTITDDITGAGVTFDSATGFVTNN